MEIKTAAMKPQINRFFERIINMIIDRERVKNTFAEYISGYNATDPKIKLKIDHTYRVAELCELIARNLKLDEYETDVAWLTGMLHDVGRFEQIKRYNTFNDAQSVDHANFGADLLFKEGLIDTYVDGFHDDKYGVIVENAIRNHSAFRIDERLDEYTVMFCNILRDADKVDIFRVNIDIRPSLGKQNGREVSPPVLDDLLFITVRRWYGVRHPHLPWRFLPVTVPLLGVCVFSREWGKAAAPLFLLGQLRQDLHYGRSVRFRPGLPG
jgi:putative nucleotidyltransferase with HDIG domain